MFIYPAKYLSWQIYKNSVYIMDERTEKFRKLDYAAVTLWEILQEINLYEDILGKISEIFTMPGEVLRKSLDEFLTELSTYEIIEVRDEAR